MNKNPIAFGYFLVFLLVGVIFTSTILGAKAEKLFYLSQNIKDVLIKSDPILGKKITHAIFSGKPVLVTFFASW